MAAINALNTVIAMGYFLPLGSKVILSLLIFLFVPACLKIFIRFLRNMIKPDQEVQHEI